MYPEISGDLDLEGDYSHLRRIRVAYQAHRQSIVGLESRMRLAFSTVKSFDCLLDLPSTRAAVPTHVGFGLLCSE